MISLKAIHPSFNPTKHNIYYTRFSIAKSSSLCLCKSNGNESDSQASLPEGDPKSQELLAQIAMLQTQKVRLTDYLDERSKNLTEFGEAANAEFDRIGEDALKGLDEAGARVCFSFFLINPCNSMFVILV